MVFIVEYLRGNCYNDITKLHNKLSPARCSITMTSLWARRRLNSRRLDCLLIRLFRRRSKKTSKLRVTDLCAGNSPETDEFPHTWSVTRKMFPFDDVNMNEYDIRYVPERRMQLCDKIGQFVPFFDKYPPFLIIESVKRPLKKTSFNVCIFPIILCTGQCVNLRTNQVDPGLKLQ